MTLTSTHDNSDCYFIFGNHGDSPVQVEDYYSLLKEFVFYCTGRTLAIERHPVPGALNFLLEAFDRPMADAILAAKKADPRTSFICVATEFRTGNTFNNFTGKSFRHPQPIFDDKFLLSQSQRDRLKRSAPILFYPLRLIYRLIKKPKPVVPEGIPSHYSNEEYWRTRFGWFKTVIPFMDQVWPVSSEQMEGYRGLVDADRLWQFPIIPFTDSPVPNSVGISPLKNIDVLFTGTMTTYRNTVLEKLSRLNLNVVTGSFTLPTFVRESYLERAKICIHIKQSEDWRFTSVMRLHHLLMRAKYVVSESSTDSPIQSRYVHLAPSDQIAETVTAQLQRSDLDASARQARASYVADTKFLREAARDKFLRDLKRSSTGPQPMARLAELNP